MENNMSKNESKSLEKSNKKSFKKIFISLKDDEIELTNRINSVVESVNSTGIKNKITINDVAKFALTLVNKSHAEAIKNMFMDNWEKIELELKSFNKKNNENLTLDQFLMRKLKIQ